MDEIPLLVLFIATTIIVIAAIEVGYILGKYVRVRLGVEKESSVSAIAAATIGLLAFILAFTFDTVSNRYEYRKQLVREDANVIRTAWLQADFLKEPYRTNSIKLYRKYVQIRAGVVTKKTFTRDDLYKAHITSLQIQHELWRIVVVNVNKTGDTNIIAQYVESLNNVISLHALRVAVFSNSSIPLTIWMVIYILAILSMMSIGYQVASAHSRRSLEMVILSLSFSMVILLIATIDRPLTNTVAVSQKPMVSLLKEMDQYYQGNL